MPRNLLFGFVLLALATTSGCIIIDDDDGSSDLTVANRSSYVLTEVRLAEINDPTWGRNLLPQPLFPNEDLVIGGIDCGRWDVMVVDNTSVECVLSDIDLCFDSHVWVVDNTT